MARLRWLLVAGAVAAACPACEDSTDDAGAACAVAAECDDGNLCTDDSCESTGACVHVAVADGPADPQIAGDCARRECLSGQLVDTYDATDTLDDENPCTADSCTAEGPTSVPVAVGSPCVDDEGTDGTCNEATCVTP